MEYTKYLKKVEKRKLSASCQADIVKVIERYLNEEGEDLSLLDKSSPQQGDDLKFLSTLSTEELFDDLISDKRTVGFTQTYQNYVRNNGFAEDIKDFTIRIYKTICLNYGIPFRMLLIPDTDEVGNFHYHGLIKIPIKYRPTFKRMVNKYLGWCKFDYIRNNEKWKKYCFKDVYTKDEIEHLKLQILY